MGGSTCECNAAMGGALGKKCSRPGPMESHGHVLVQRDVVRCKCATLTAATPAGTASQGAMSNAGCHEAQRQGAMSWHGCRAGFEGWVHTRVRLPGDQLVSLPLLQDDQASDVTRSLLPRGAYTSAHFS